MIADRNYFYVCLVKVTYNEEKVKSLKKMAIIHNNFLEIKKHMQLCIDFDPSCQVFCIYHYRKTSETGLRNFKWQYLYSWILHYIYELCQNDKYFFLNAENVCVQAEDMVKSKNLIFAVIF